MNMFKIKNIEKLGTIAIILEKVFHNGSNYVYHFMIKLLAEELVRYFTYLRPNAEKYITFSVPLEKEVRRFDKKGI